VLGAGWWSFLDPVPIGPDFEVLLNLFMKFYVFALKTVFGHLDFGGSVEGIG